MLQHARFDLRRLIGKSCIIYSWLLTCTYVPIYEGRVYYIRIPNCNVSNSTLSIFAHTRTYSHWLCECITEANTFITWRTHKNAAHNRYFWWPLICSLSKNPSHTTNESKCYQDTNYVNKNHKGYGIQKYKIHSKTLKKLQRCIAHCTNVLPWE